MGRQVVLIARERITDRDNRLAALPEMRELRSDFLELAETAAIHAVELKHHRLDARVIARRAQRLDDVPNQSFLQRRASCARDGAGQRITRQLVDKVAFGRDHERGRARHEHAVPDRGDDQHQENEEQDDEVQQPAQTVESVPDGRQHPYWPCALFHTCPYPSPLSMQQH